MTTLVTFQKWNPHVWRVCCSNQTYAGHIVSFEEYIAIRKLIRKKFTCENVIIKWKMRGFQRTKGTVDIVFKNQEDEDYFVLWSSEGVEI
jgi:hypothetical protein